MVTAIDLANSLTDLAELKERCTQESISYFAGIPDKEVNRSSKLKDNSIYQSKYFPKRKSNLDDVLAGNELTEAERKILEERLPDIKAGLGKTFSRKDGFIDFKDYADSGSDLSLKITRKKDKYYLTFNSFTIVATDEQGEIADNISYWHYEQGKRDWKKRPI